MINNPLDLSIRGTKTSLALHFNTLNICAERNTDVIQYRIFDTLPVVHILEGEIQYNQNILVNVKAQIKKAREIT